MDLVGLTRVICEYEFDKAGVRLQSMGTFSGLNPDRTDMRHATGFSGSAELQNTAGLWCQRLNVSPFSHSPFMYLAV
jgi:hypothetical protein